MPDTVAITSKNLAENGTGTFVITVSGNNRTTTQTITITAPSSTNAPNGQPWGVTNQVPAIIGGMATLRNNGYAGIAITGRSDSAYTGPAQDLYQYQDTTVDQSAPSAVMRSAWAVGRLIDGLELLDAEGLSIINPKWLLVTGISRGGKQAMIEGAFAESLKGTKIAVTNPVSSGSGGAAIERFISTAFKGEIYRKDLNDTKGGTAHALLVGPNEGGAAYTFGGIQTFPSVIGDGLGWTSGRMKTFKNVHPEWKVNKSTAQAYYFGIFETIPFDAHFLTGICAQRGLLIQDGWRADWENPEGTYFSYLATREIYDFLDVYDNIGVRLYDITHANPTREQYDFVDFANLYFNKTFGTNFSRIEGETTYSVLTYDHFQDKDPLFAGANYATWFDSRSKDPAGHYEYLKLNWANPQKPEGSSVADIVKERTGFSNE
jgi:hypothetical protein